LFMQNTAQITGIKQKRNVYWLNNVKLKIVNPESREYVSIKPYYGI